MKHRFGLGIVWGLFLLGPQGLRGTSIEQQHGSGLNLAVCDQTGLDSKTLDTARQHTLRVFSGAGVDITWIDLDRRSKCKLPSGEGNYFVVAIQPKAPEGWTSPDTMGFAPSRTGRYPRAYVFYNHVRILVDLFERNDRREWARGVVLGHAIAHELGHLLIPGDAHALTGIMSTLWHYQQWEDTVAGRLLFNTDQIKAIQKSLKGK